MGNLIKVSGGRVSNAWVTYPGHRDSGGLRSFAKVPVILDDIHGPHDLWIKGWGPSGLSAWERPMSYQLVGGVMAYQGDDG